MGRPDHTPATSLLGGKGILHSARGVPGAQEKLQVWGAFTACVSLDASDTGPAASPGGRASSATCHRRVTATPVRFGRAQRAITAFGSRSRLGVSIPSRRKSAKLQKGSRTSREIQPLAEPAPTAPSGLITRWASVLALRLPVPLARNESTSRKISHCLPSNRTMQWLEASQI